MQLRILASAALLVLAAVPVRAQCHWEADLPRRASDARDVLAYRAVTAAHRSAIVSAVVAAGVAEPKGVVAVTAERNGADARVQAFDTNFPAALLYPLTSALAEPMKQLPAQGMRRVATLVRLDTVALPPARADGKRRECKPILVNRMTFVDELNRWRDSPEGETRQRAEVGMVVDRDGRVRHVEILAPSGSERFDQFARRLAAGAQMRPATEDGVPMDAWVRLPISVQ
ncbi:MAG: hypothetical protein AVDCRST_MAG68-2550 [uncultured Gemmatimonadetes bacterium]|uniref:TonB C-terminal domain-containing protein n=1 Tax=uncultured Gemmatimonadota bacterium TaxID=203437 RepID=A0A6J4LGU4_9BACT|nr:MAG: hypothetical protein AVDCRST_MAG68-2550 [uncultured Gemmatimonadota bacterium]